MRSGSLRVVDLDAAPILVFWETTRACLLACRHCRAEAMELPLPGELTADESLTFIRSLTAFGSRPPVLVLTGGDVLMRPDHLELAAFARSLGIPVGLAPSVTPLLTPAIVRRLERLDVKSVSISLDGATAATHEGIRGVPGHFERTLDTLDLLTRRGFTVQVNTAVMRDNVEELADVAALLRIHRVGIWEVFFLVKVGRGAGVEDLSPTENEDVAHFLFDAACHGLTVRTVEAPFFRRVVQVRSEAGPEMDAAETFSLGPLYRRLAMRLSERLGEPDGPIRARSGGTRDGKGIVFVAHDGVVYPAGFLPFPLGNVRQRSVVDIYRNHPLLRAIRDARFTGRCGACKYREICGGSRARAFAASGDPLGEDPACAYKPEAALR